MFDKIFAELLRLDKESDEDHHSKLLQTLFDVTDDILRYKNFDNMIIFIDKFIELKFLYDLHIGLLSVCYRSKAALPNYSKLYNSTLEAGMLTYTEEETKNALYGLEG